MVEPNLSEISSDTIRSILLETIENQIKSSNVKVNVSSASQAGDNNFIGIVYRVSFNSDDDTDNEKKLILKVAPQNVARRTQFFSRPCFLREIYMYETVRIQSFDIT